MQQSLDFNCKIREIGAAHARGMRPSPASGRFEATIIQRQQWAEFLPSSALNAAGTTLLFRISEANADESGFPNGLVLVDCAVDRETIIPGAIYAIKSASGAIRLTCGEEVVAGTETLVGRVVKLLPGARSLRYVRNVSLLQEQRRYRRTAVAQ